MKHGSPESKHIVRTKYTLGSRHSTKGKRRNIKYLMKALLCRVYIEVMIFWIELVKENI